MPTPSQSGKARITQAERRKRVYELLQDGKTHRQIQAAIGCSANTLHEDVKAVRASIPAQAAEDYRATQLERYAKLWESLQPGIDAGEAKAVSVANRLLASEALLLGLNAPQQVNVQNVNVTMEGVDPGVFK